VFLTRCCYCYYDASVAPRCAEGLDGHVLSLSLAMQALCPLLLLGLCAAVCSLQISSLWTNRYSVSGIEILSSDQNFNLHTVPALHHNQVALLDTKSGWGDGTHPTTKLCLDFITQNIKGNEILLDYGTGSGILSIVAAKLGAKHCIAVDIDEDTLEAAQKNAGINHVKDSIQIVHTKSVYIGDNSFPLADITVANILPGPLSRLVAPLWLLTKPGGRLCLSGMRPHELPGIRRFVCSFC
jgi:ribosomal protein L11 methylase PrmA